MKVYVCIHVPMKKKINQKEADSKHGAGFLCGLFFHPEDASEMFLRIVR
jgi:hypothetical protein